MPASSSPSDAARRWARPGPRARALFLQVHLWLGLSLGAVVALVGLSGALLVFLEPLVRAEHGPALFPATENAADQSRWAPVEDWVANARARYPDLGHLDAVTAPGAAPVPSAVPLLVGHVDLPGGAHGHLVVPVDPVRAEPLGRFVFEETWAGALMTFHVELLAGATGDQLVAWASLAALLSLGTGAYLWWPRRPGGWGRALRFRRGAAGRRRLLDWHNVAAVWLFLPLALALLSGLYLVRPDWFDPALRLASPIREPDPALLAGGGTRDTSCGSGLGIDAALDLALARHPGSQLRIMAIPEDGAEPYFVGLVREGADPKVWHTELWVDRSCPRVLFARDGAGLTGGELVKSWAPKLHRDLGLGAPGQALVLAAGLLLPLLWTTGLLLWLDRRRRRRLQTGSAPRMTTDGRMRNTAARP